MKKPEPKQPTLLEMLEAVWRDSDVWLAGWIDLLADTGNPYYAWLAIDVCIRHQKEFPKVLVAYLAQCAERMKSDRAKKHGDLRKVLPWVFGFPDLLERNQRKRGPGNLLDPDGGDPDFSFGLRFAIRLMEGEDPHAAMRNACNDVFDEKNASRDDKTHQNWLLKSFNLKEWPSTAEEWKTIAREHYGSFWKSLRKHWEEKKSRETLS
jgi:hypothetical protein